MTKEQFDACWEHSYKDCNKCLLIECPHNLSDDDGFEEVKMSELFLLSIEEYEKYKGVIPVIGSWWLLRSPGYSSYRAASVSSSGSVYADGISVDLTSGIRPALRVSKSEISNLQIGDRKIYYDFPFIKIDEDLLIAEVPIAFDEFADKSNDYEKSYVKRFLEEWKEGR